MREIENLRRYLKIPTAHPNIDYGPVIELLKEVAEDLELRFTVYECVDKHPIAVLTWSGTEPTLPSILLNSHMDTVPVIKENWTRDPFGADVDSFGNIHGRGAQDCKGIGMIYLEAIRKLKNFRLRRTVHVLFVPDEELGGGRGMVPFVGTKDFHDLNVGFAIDEGFANPDNKFTISYSDRMAWKFVVHCSGQPELGSLIPTDTPGEKAAHILNKFYELRREQKRKLGSMPLGDLISVNLTQLQAKKSQAGVIPERLSLVFDCRLPPSTDLAQFEARIMGWFQEAGDGVTIEYLTKNVSYSTKLDDANVHWVAFKKVLNNLQVPFETIVYPATTDGHHLRGAGVPTIGFVPLRNTIPLKHADNEYLSQRAFLEAIDVYTQIIPAVANV